MIEKAMSSPSEDPLYVVAIGAITNVASALLLAPEIVHKIVVVWLGRASLELAAYARIQPGGGCAGGASRARQRRTLCDCALHGRDLSLADHAPRVAGNYRRDKSGRRLSLPDLQGISSRLNWASSVIWDISTIAWLLNSDWVPSNLVHSPLLTDQVTWSVDQSRHLVRVANFVHRDPIFRDMFNKIRALGCN